MAEYHVGCGFFDIYAGTLKKNGKEWLNKSNVTNEAISAVARYMFLQIPEGENTFAYAFKMPTGTYVRLKVEESDTCPEWAREAFGEGEQDG